MIIYFLAAIGGLVSTLAVLFLCSQIFFYVSNTIEQIRYNKIRAIFISELSSIERWCGHEFPQVGLVMRELASEWKRGVLIDPNELREQLRGKSFTKENLKP